MNFCEHCEGQRFDRARILRALRRTRADVRTRADGRRAAEAIGMALRVVRALDIPHLEPIEDEVIH